MSEGGELMHFRDWRCQTGSQAHDAPGLWRSRCSGLVAVPVSTGLATLVLPVGTSSFRTRRLTAAQKFGTGC
jgi:hypothetical protein